MHQDGVTTALRLDSLIMKFGSRLHYKHGHLPHRWQWQYIVMCQHRYDYCCLRKFYFIVWHTCKIFSQEVELWVVGYLLRPSARRMHRCTLMLNDIWLTKWKYGTVTTIWHCFIQPWKLRCCCIFCRSYWCHRHTPRRRKSSAHLGRTAVLNMWFSDTWCVK